MQGVITLWNPERSFGFITTPTGARFFFHRNNLKKGQDPVIDGQVDFEVGPGITTGKKPQAIQVRYSRTEDAAVAEILSAAKKVEGSIQSGADGAQ